MARKRKGIICFECVKVSQSEALTLNPSEVCEGHRKEVGQHTRVHEDGWTITGDIEEEYFFWVNEFSAVHPKYGMVWGNFEKTVYATSKRAFKHFCENHPYESWDYCEI